MEYRLSVNSATYGYFGLLLKECQRSKIVYYDKPLFEACTDNEFSFYVSLFKNGDEVKRYGFYSYEKTEMETVKRSLIETALKSKLPWKLYEIKDIRDAVTLAAKSDYTIIIYKQDGKEEGTTSVTETTDIGFDKKRRMMNDRKTK